MKTRIVKFSYGTVKDASLKVPAEACSIFQIVSLIRESYFDYAFRPGCGLMSDEVLTSSIGQSNFFAGALGGYETRVPAKDFSLIKEMLMDDIAQALAVARRRLPANADRNAVWLRASENDVLPLETREYLKKVATHLPAVA